MKALIVNDDGVRAEGIKLLVEKIYKYCDKICVVAPMSEKSAVSHSLTIRTGLVCEKLDNIYKDVATYGLTGTPADCVAFAKDVLNIDFDTVFSGINRGYNLGDDIMYSGTVAAAREGVMNGKRGIAISCKYDSFEAVNCFDQIMEYLLASTLFDEKVIININIPKYSQGIKITRQTKSTYKKTYIKKEDNMYYSLCDINPPLLDDEFGDVQTIKKGYISITPLTINYTDNEIYNKYH